MQDIAFGAVVQNSKLSLDQLRFALGGRFLGATRLLQVHMMALPTQS